ncbi:MAG TPA: DEAD/DEAH box helicase family protein, partial [Methylomirabilota bacterium]|nr:DEAD/DEAH box helicase family protein [Methylomirabilota bacterium]
LHRELRIRHFFVLAPNLTIYDKLVRDFTPNTPKYVLQGLGEFASNPPEIITGDNYESGRGTRQAELFGTVHVNIFNISKMNAEVRGGRAPRIKRLSECIGQSYFEYLAGLEDLVLIMDESHRYRADAGVRVLNELRPILGLELTATPQVERAGGAEPFRNVIYEYRLAEAIRDGFVKEPAVSTRADFDPRAVGQAELERVKLEDGVILHEHTKAHLQVYADQHGLPRVKPFVLVVTQDTTHAGEIEARIKQDDFFAGRYKDKVITVHSNLRGEEKDETVQALLRIESPEEPAEIVIHVNMLKEGWDVTNLYTIVPLRAANSRTLVEQSIGRGLRLPYGKRTGVAAVDRLTIVAHDRFQEIIDDANRPDSVIRVGVVIGRDIPTEAPQAVRVLTVLESLIRPAEAGVPSGAPSLFVDPREQAAAAVTLDIIRDYQRLPRSRDLQSPDVQAEITSRVRSRLQPQGGLPGMPEPVDPARVVAEVTAEYVKRNIDIPRIVLTPAGEVTSGYRDFDLDVRTIRLQPVAKDILVHHLQTNQRERVETAAGVMPEQRPEDYIVRCLIDFDDVSYDDHAVMLYKLAGQAVSHLRTYLADEAEVLNVLQFHQKTLAGLIYAQMEQHHHETATQYVVKVTRGFIHLEAADFTLPAGESIRDFRAVPETARDVGSLLFGKFSKCPYLAQRFQSTPEWRFAGILEADPDVIKWVKPTAGRFQIFYRGDHPYEPDFVVETAREKLLCEVKAARDMDDAEVLAKNRAAVEWCGYASDHERRHGGKPWRYVLIPHDAVEANRTLAGLTAQFTVK